MSKTHVIVESKYDENGQLKNTIIGQRKSPIDARKDVLQHATTQHTLQTILKPGELPTVEHDDDKDGITRIINGESAFSSFTKTNYFSDGE